MKKNYPMIYDKEHYTCMANDIVKGKQDMTLQEAKIIRLLITQVVKEDKDLKTYSCKIQDLANYLGITSQTLYRDIRSICINLMQRVIYKGTGNPKQPWEIIQWLQKASYDGNGILTLMLSEQIKPFVLDLNKWFTQYQIKNILEFKSFYAIRLYELLKCEEGVNREEKEYYEFTIKRLREFFCCEKKYKKIIDFKRKVIEIAVREINEKSDLYIEVEYIKTGRAITSIKFFVHPNYKQYNNKEV